MTVRWWLTKRRILVVSLTAAHEGKVRCYRVDRRGRIAGQHGLLRVDRLTRIAAREAKQIWEGSRG